MFTAFTTQIAEASRASDLAEYLDNDAPIAVRMDLEQIELAVEIYRTSGIAGSSQSVLFASAAAVAILGFDPMVSAGWFSAGFDGTSPILMSIGALDKAARVPGKPPRFWRSRIVLSVDNRPRADATLHRVSRLMPDMLVLPTTNDAKSSRSGKSAARAVAIARTLGTTPKRSAAISNRLRSAGVIAIARIQLPFGDTLVFIHRRGNVAIVDLLTLFGEKNRWQWRRDGAAVRAALARRPRRFAKRLSSGAAAALDRPGLALWADATLLYDALGAARDHAAAHIQNQGRSAEPKVCAGFRQLAATGPFRDMAATLFLAPTRSGSLHKRSIRADVRWGLRPAFKLARFFLVADDRLAVPRRILQSAAGKVAAVGGLYLASTKPLRRLPRPALLDLPRRQLRWALMSCGLRAPLTLAAVGWPQLMGMFLDQLAGVHPEAATLVDNVRNGFFMVTHASFDSAKIGAVLEASIGSAGAALPAHYLDVVFGSSQDKSITSRDKTSPNPAKNIVTTWGHGPLRPYRWTTLAGVTVFGAALDPKLVAKRMHWRPSQPAAGKTSKRLLAEIFVNPTKLVNDLSAELPVLKFLGPLMRRTSAVAWHTRFAGDVLESVFTASIR